MYLKKKCIRLSETVIPMEYTRKGELVHHDIKILGLDTVELDPDILCVSGKSTLEKGEDHNWMAILGESSSDSSGEGVGKNSDMVDIDDTVRLQNEFSHLRNEIDGYYFKIKNLYSRRQFKTEKFRKELKKSEETRHLAESNNKATKESVDELTKYAKELERIKILFDGDWSLVGPGSKYHVDMMEKNSGVLTLYLADHTTEIGRAQFLDGHLHGRFQTKYEGTDYINLIIDYCHGLKEYVYVLDENGVLIVAEHYKNGHKVERNEFYSDTGMIKRIVWMLKKEEAGQQNVDMMEFDDWGRVIYNGPGICIRNEDGFYTYQESEEGLKFGYTRKQNSHDYDYASLSVTQNGENSSYELFHQKKPSGEKLKVFDVGLNRHIVRKSLPGKYTYYYGTYGVILMSDSYRKDGEIANRIYYYPNFSNIMEKVNFEPMSWNPIETPHLLKVLYGNMALLRKKVTVDKEGHEHIIKENKNYHSNLLTFPTNLSEYLVY